MLATQKRVNDLLASKLDLTVAQQALLAKQNRQLDAAYRATRDAAAAAPRNTTRLPVTLGVTEPFVTTFTVAGYAALLLACRSCSTRPTPSSCRPSARRRRRSRCRSC